MRRPFVAGNWKMNLVAADAKALAEAIVARSSELSAADLAVFPPFVYLPAVAKLAAGHPLAVGAQNMYHADAGAFTGEISGSMLRDVGATHCILGHSERRHVLGETDADVALKVNAALEQGIIPVVCVGETLDQRESGNTQSVIAEQFAGSLEGVSDEQITSVILAYEPVWAIGTGKVATPEQAQDVHLDLRKLLEARYNSDVASQVRILYGGSVKPDNASSLLSQSDVDGALVGGASLKASDFLAIAEAAHELAKAGA